ncbi:redoxin domain-containing protein [Halobacillus yeomjeoni]|uniref:peroxiredoxin family protein n=1 Tax=Halobacillus yeomjeoni TaxID=311194 RepID=UPI001CD74354|nr:redoxin domain-containing protein [Halobacillus yeomjeoni]MCA0985004.1 redoxin domain-containing protein [Halobacillus yeomjeoni]
MCTFELGTQVPDYRLPDVKGKIVSLNEQLNEHQSWQLIIFFRGAWCPVCVQDLKDLQESKDFLEGKDVYITAISTDRKENLQAMAEENGFTFPVLSDEYLVVLQAFQVHYHSEDAPYEDHGAHGEAAYFLVNEKGELLYQQRQTSPFGRPTATELRKIVQYIKKNLKE